MQKFVISSKRAMGAFKAKATGVAIVAGALVVTGPAFAQATGVGTVISGEINSAKPEMLLVIGAMAGALVLLVVWGLIKGSMRK